MPLMSAVPRRSTAPGYGRGYVYQHGPGNVGGGGMQPIPGTANAGGMMRAPAAGGGMRSGYVYDHGPGNAGGAIPSTGGMNAGGAQPPVSPQLQQGGMSAGGLPKPAGAQGVIPTFEDGGSMDDPSGFGGVSNDDNSSAFDTIDQVIQYGRQKHGLGGGNSSGNDQGSGSFMNNAVAGARQFVGSGVLGKAPLKAGDDAWNKFHGDDSPDAMEDGGPVDDDDDDDTGAIPTRPAGPGGDQPDTNPFPIKRPNPPFGKRSYAEGGSVDDDDDDSDSTGAIPDDADGDDTAQQSAPQQSEGMGSQPNPQRLVSYLTGADAAPPQVVAALERSVDPQGQLDPDTRHAMAIDQASKQGGQEAAWGVLQHYRKKYDAYKSFAAAAINGVAGKPPDIAAAAQAATQAYSYMPDGTTVQFQPSQSGITATVKRAGGQQPFGSVNLTPQQFHEFVRGQAGQFDNVLENSGPRVLQQLQQQQGRPFDQGQQQAQQGAPTGPATGQQPMGRQQPFQPTAEHPSPNEYDFSGTQGNPEAEKRRLAGYAAGEKNAEWDPKLMARATQLFPNDRQKALQWVVEQEQQGEENQTNRAKAEAPLKRAQVYTEAKGKQVADTNATRRDIEFAKMNVNSNDRQLAAASRLVASVNNAPTPYDPDSDVGKSVAGALKFLRTYNYGNQGGVQRGTPAQQGQQPPKPGARQDPQGRWREKGPDGLWHLIQK